MYSVFIECMCLGVTQCWPLKKFKYRREKILSTIPNLKPLDWNSKLYIILAILSSPASPASLPQWPFHQSFKSKHVTNRLLLFAGILPIKTPCVHQPTSSSKPSCLWCLAGQFPLLLRKAFAMMTKYTYKSIPEIQWMISKYLKWQDSYFIIQLKLCLTTYSHENTGSLLKFTWFLKYLALLMYHIY